MMPGPSHHVGVKRGSDQPLMESAMTNMAPDTSSNANLVGNGMPGPSHHVGVKRSSDQLFVESEMTDMTPGPVHHFGNLVDNMMPGPSHRVGVKRSSDQLLVESEMTDMALGPFHRFGNLVDNMMPGPSHRVGVKRSSDQLLVESEMTDMAPGPFHRFGNLVDNMMPGPSHHVGVKRSSDQLFVESEMTDMAPGPFHHFGNVDNMMPGPSHHVGVKRSSDQLFVESEMTDMAPGPFHHFGNVDNMMPGPSHHVGVKRESDQLLLESAMTDNMLPGPLLHLGVKRGSNEHDNSRNAKKIKLEPSVGNPSRILLITNIPNGVRDFEIVDLAIPFGRVTSVLFIESKNQAFLEMVDESAANAMITCYTGCMVQLRGCPVYIQFANDFNWLASTEAALLEAQLAAKAIMNATSVIFPPGTDNDLNNGQGIQEIPKTVLRMIINQLINPINVEILHMMFQRYGEVVKIVSFTKRNTFHALIEFTDTKSTQAARESLTGAKIYPGHYIYVDYSRLGSINVKYNNDQSRDFTNPNLPTGYGNPITNSTTPAIHRKPYTVLRMIVKDMTIPLSVDVLFSIFQCFGKVLKIVSFIRYNSFHALIQFGNAQGAKRAKHSLHGTKIHPHFTLCLDYSNMLSLNVKYNNDQCRDFTNSALPTGDEIIQMALLGSELSADMLPLAAQPTLSRQQLANLYYSGAPLGYAPPSFPFGQAPLGLCDLPAPSVNPGPSSPFGQAPPGLCDLPAPNLNQATVLLVSNLNTEMVTTDVLFTLFGVYGNVLLIKLLYRTKSSALVQMGDPYHARLAIQYINKLRVFGRTIRVAVSKITSIRMPPEGQAETGRTKDYSESPLNRFNRPGSNNFLNMYPPCPTLHLSNIPFTSSEEEIKDAFTKRGFQVKKFTFLGSERRMALVQFEGIVEAVEALIKMDNFELSATHPKRLRVNFAKINMGTGTKSVEQATEVQSKS